MSIRSRGPKSQKLSNSMTWLDQNCPTKGAFFGMFYFMGKCVICHNIFMTSLILFILGTIQIISQIMRNYSSVLRKVLNLHFSQTKGDWNFSTQCNGLVFDKKLKEEKIT